MQGWQLFRRKMNWAEKWVRVFRITFRSMHGQQALMDLSDYCYATASTYDPDPIRSAMNVGRREVWLHIMELTQLTPEELLAVYERRGFHAETEPDEGAQDA